MDANVSRALHRTKSFCQGVTVARLNIGVSESGAGTRSIDVAETSCDELDYRIPHWKRTLDLCWILATSPIWLPLIIAMVFAVKIVSRGPVFYRQRRVGYLGQHFMIYKFRSMKVNADTSEHEKHVGALIRGDKPMTKLDSVGDSRLIPGARLMRALGLDELPQIFNVLKGEMSLVGPRPCTPPEFECYLPSQQRRVDVPPGLTGLWQVSGKNSLTFSQMIALDLRYCDTMSIGLDNQIILRTIPALLHQAFENYHKRKAASRS